MRVALIDCEYNEGASRIPNPWLMKLSSFFKQQGNQVSLVTEVTRPDAYDLIVVAKEASTQYLPPLNILTLEQTRLIGRTFKRHDKFWELPIGVYKARPDYNLYSFEFPGEHTKASFINLTYKGELIAGQSQARDKRSLAIHYVIDKNLWSSPQLGDILDELSKYNKLIFLEEVDLTFLKTKELIQKFAKLRTHTTQIKLKNNSSLEQFTHTVNLIKEIRKIKQVSFTNLTFVTQTKDLEANEALKRYFEVIKIARIANENSLVVNFLVPREESFENAYIFQDFRYFNNKNSSFFTFLLKGTNLEPAAAMSNISLWGKEPVNLIWKLYYFEKEVFEDGFIEWGGFPDKTRNNLKEGDAKRFYDLFIL